MRYFRQVASWKRKTTSARRVPFRPIRSCSTGSLIGILSNERVVDEAACIKLDPERRQPTGSHRSPTRESSGAGSAESPCLRGNRESGSRRRSFGMWRCLRVACFIRRSEVPECHAAAAGRCLCVHSDASVNWVAAKGEDRYRRALYTKFYPKCSVSAPDHVRLSRFPERLHGESAIKYASCSR